MLNCLVLNVFDFIILPAPEIALTSGRLNTCKHCTLIYFDILSLNDTVLLALNPRCSGSHCCMCKMTKKLQSQHILT